MASLLSTQQQWDAAVSAGAYSHLSAYASGEYDREQAISYLLDLYGRLGQFTRAAAEMVINTYDAGRIGVSFTEGADDGSDIIPVPGAAQAAGAAGSYQYEVSVEFECYGVTDSTFVRIVSDSALSFDELYGQALDSAFERITSPTLGGGSAEENCEPTGNMEIHTAYALQ